MRTETKICQSCKKDFIIESEDFKFYEKIKVPPPTWCPECRLVRRLAYIGDRSLYKNTCSRCGESVVSLFRPESSFIVFCNSCWWGDGWDPLEYGRDYDFSKPFFEQFYELRKAVPFPATDNRNCTNCDYCDTVIRCKDCTLTFGGLQSINCYYCGSPLFSRDSLDADIVLNADHVYEIVNSNGLYNTKFAYFSDECLDSSFLFNCIGCSNCFGCVNLRNQKYCIFNKKYSKEEYQKELAKWDLGSYKIIQSANEKFMELYYKTPRRFALIVNSTNVTGDDIKNTKNCKNCFVTRHGVENCKNIFICGLLLKDSHDTTTGGNTSELLYENASNLQSQRVMFSHGCNNSTDIEYSDRIYNCSNCFGCTMFKNKKYCIFNKQYTKEEYEVLIPKIKKHMDDMPYVDKKGRIYKYGEFFPPENSVRTYNESWGIQFSPKTREEALEQGYTWLDPVKRDYKVTIKAKDLPNNIDDVSDSILNEVIACEHAVTKDGITYESGCDQQCTTAFRILPYELSFYRSMRLALPHICFNCRYYERLKKVNQPKLYHRKCMCNGVKSEKGEYGNTIKHIHGDEPCQNEFETAISEDRKEIVYCEKCYQAEFV
ncbi:MAG: hypothetical protein WCS86_03530 [Candidatus Paceibacterota bacterium]